MELEIYNTSACESTEWWILGHSMPLTTWYIKQKLRLLLYELSLRKLTECHSVF